MAIFAGVGISLLAASVVLALIPTRITGAWQAWTFQRIVVLTLWAIACLVLYEVTK